MGAVDGGVISRKTSSPLTPAGLRGTRHRTAEPEAIKNRNPAGNARASIWWVQSPSTIHSAQAALPIVSIAGGAPAIPETIT